MSRAHLAVIVMLLSLLMPGAYANTAWETYINEPSPANATQVATLAYSEGALPKDYGYWSPHLQILKNQLLARDAAAFQMAVRLMKTADGGLLEELMAVLGSVVRAHPTFFLGQLSKSEIGDESLKSILLMPGLEYVDLATAETYEISQRRAALAAVKDAELVLMRNRCLHLMDVAVAN